MGAKFVWLSDIMTINIEHFGIVIQHICPVSTDDFGWWSGRCETAFHLWADGDDPALLKPLSQLGMITFHMTTVIAGWLA